MNSIEYKTHWEIYFRVNGVLEKLRKEYDGYFQQIEVMRNECESVNFDFTYYENILMGQANTIDEKISYLEKELRESCIALGFNNKNIILCN